MWRWPRVRRYLVILLHVALFAAAYYLAYAVRFDFDIPGRYWNTFVYSLPIVLLLKLVPFKIFGQYGSSLRYVSLEDLKRILAASALATLVLIALDRLRLPYIGIPRSVFVLDWVLTVSLISGARIGLRMASEHRLPLFGRSGLRRIFIAGAGDAGEGLLRELRRRSKPGYVCVGFLDDDQAKRGLRIGGVPVLGALDEAGELAEEYGVRESVIAIPSASGPEMRAIVRKLQRAGLAFRTLPPIGQIMGGKVDPDQIHSVTIEELLGRTPVVLDTDRVGALLEGKVVAVTGAAGSIGSELCRQVLRFRPARLVPMDRSENGLFLIERELAGRTDGAAVTPLLADVTDRDRIDQVFRAHAPTVVFHAAAHKHVPMMERSACEAVKNNVFGTKVVADLSILRGVEKFVLISTDKAVNPVGVMGMTKRLAELYVHALGRSRGSDFVAVRFGNVLGSSGSVVPIFKEQIEKGGPLTVTHPEMSRYFMTIPEAVQLVLEAAAIGKTGEILVLDMGEPVRIVDLARELIGLSGLREPEDIEIEFRGIRPGEKLVEELCGRGEELLASDHEKVRVVRGSFPDMNELTRGLVPLKEAADRGDEAGARRLVSELSGPPTGGPD